MGVSFPCKNSHLIHLVYVVKILSCIVERIFSWVMIMNCSQHSEVWSFSTSQNVMVALRSDPGSAVPLIFVFACVFSNQFLTRASAWGKECLIFFCLHICSPNFCLRWEDHSYLYKCSYTKKKISAHTRKDCFSRDLTVWSEVYCHCCTFLQGSENDWLSVSST